MQKCIKADYSPTPISLILFQENYSFEQNQLWIRVDQENVGFALFQRRYVGNYFAKLTDAGPMKAKLIQEIGRTYGKTPE